MGDTLNSLLTAQHSSSVLDSIAHPSLVNPLAAINSGNQAAMGVYNLREKQAQQAWGEILQQSTDENGNVDYGKAQHLAAGNPTAAMGMMSALKDTSGLRTSQFNLNSAQNNSVNGAVTAALAESDPERMKQVVYEQMQRQVQMGLIPMDKAMTALHNMSTDPAEMRRQLEAIRIQTLPEQQKQNWIYGTRPAVSAGGSTEFPTVPEAGRGPAPSVPHTMSAESTAAYQQWLKGARDYPDPANPTVTKHGTNETFLRDSGTPEQFIYPGGAPATPGTQPTTSPLGTGRPPPALLNPNKPQVTLAPAATPSPAGTGISGPTPAQKATAGATEEQGKLSPPRFQAEADAGTQAQSQQATLGNMLADTAQFTTGPLAGIVGKVRNLAGNFGLNINTEAQSAKESFNKLAAGLANAQGAGSDQRMAVNIDANPHVELSPAGVDLVTRQLQGNADYLQARAKLAQQYPNKADYPGFQQSAAGLDPRVFQLSRMTGDQRTTYWNALDNEAQKQVGAAIKKAKDMGVLGGG